MAEATGLGIIERAALRTMRAINLGSATRLRRTAQVLSEMERRFGVTPAYGYQALFDLASDWTVNVPLIETTGNWGSRDEPPASPHANECRLSEIGALAADAEAGQVPPVPMVLMNGTMYAGGTAPPFEPLRLVDALIALVDRPHLADEELLEVVGPPSFPGECRVAGEVDKVLRGDMGQLRLQAKFRHRPDHLEITALPPGASPLEATSAIIAAKHPSIAQVLNRSRRDKVSIDIQIVPGRQHVQLETDLLMEWPLTIELDAVLAGSLPDVLRRWMAHAQDHRYLSSHLRALRGQLRNGHGRKTAEYSSVRA